MLQWNCSYKITACEDVTKRCLGYLNVSFTPLQDVLERKKITIYGSSMYSFNGKIYKCSLEATMDVLNGKWRSLILWHLIEEKLRFSQIQKIVPGISKKVLSEHLYILEKNNLIHRTIYPEVPPRVEYEISEKGKTLFNALQELETWGRIHLKSE
jgi:DNA-binding HxlR family transcriptional regulator